MQNKEFSNIQTIPIIIMIIMIASGCSKALEGKFVDNNVCGLNYKTETQSGKTDENGKFDYMKDEEIEFSVGDIVIGKGLAKEIMTPIDIVKGAKDELDPTVTNICRFLLSIDDDSSFNNGIQISSSTHEGLEDESLNFSLSKETFEERVKKLTPFKNKFVLIKEKVAQEHFRATLDNIKNEENEKNNGCNTCSFHGLYFCPYMDNQYSDSNSQIKMIKIYERMAVIKDHTEWIRTLGCSNGMENIGRVAKEFDLKVAMSARLDDNKNSNKKEINQLINEMNSGYVDIAIVGNEVLDSGFLTLDELLSYIDIIKSQTKNITVGYSDKADIFIKYPELVEKIDYILLNCQPYLEGIHIASAMLYVQNNYIKLKQKYYDGKSENEKKTIIISETGWPTQANTINNAYANITNAKDYLIHFISWAESENIEYFYFEAFDEKWTSTIDNQYNGKWGIWSSDGKIKEGVTEAFSQINSMSTEMSILNVSQSIQSTVDQIQNSEPKQIKIDNSDINRKDIINNTIMPKQEIPIDNDKAHSTFCENDQKKIVFTDVPPLGNRIKNLKGQVFNVNNTEYTVIVYCFINNIWEIMPAFVPIQENGTWTCDITAQKPYDWNATKIVAFLVPIKQIDLTINTLFENHFFYVETIRK